jgi:hypothetical protein
MSMISTRSPDASMYLVIVETFRAHVDSANTLFCIKQKPFYFTQAYLLITYYTQIIGPLLSLARPMARWRASATAKAGLLR